MTKMLEWYLMDTYIKEAEKALYSAGEAFSRKEYSMSSPVDTARSEAAAAWLIDEEHCIEEAKKELEKGDWDDPYEDPAMDPEEGVEDWGW